MEITANKTMSNIISDVDNWTGNKTQWLLCGKVKSKNKLITDIEAEGYRRQAVNNNIGMTSYNGKSCLLVINRTKLSTMESNLAKQVDYVVYIGEMEKISLYRLSSIIHTLEDSGLTSKMHKIYQSGVMVHFLERK